MESPRHRNQAVHAGQFRRGDVETSLAPDADTTASEVSALPYPYTIGTVGWQPASPPSATAAGPIL
jgi:hypothetical protein